MMRRCLFTALRHAGLRAAFRCRFFRRYFSSAIFLPLSDALDYCAFLRCRAFFGRLLSPRLRAPSFAAVCAMLFFITRGCFFISAGCCLLAYDDAPLRYARRYFFDAAAARF